ncbi:Lipopolysaccharide-assembly, LptC-related [Roseovarius sp. THAF27]|uniref:LPS export ABC transporter periplasmic protein LptC n=1 Tax=Roseovarius TaxID=74030 RepID=UPI0012695859|nr:MULTISPECIES: LPS export ABC transporter periplasmic protein LptC [Roseovarius]MBY5987108.1 LPS export ABC transporter periplasmic protein LptC [Roseovarius atlanticus]MBY6125748.1 LPS export ABC transporter periplasmic protein LptC [Roseovarius atlanticus]MBY6149791.1 LPS export ABC transporter periplasmic protein LptC [Roseovarius atlanticus]QFT83055.1 Lipopolysaccharide-assembly, LptC-related [Roseovarius sp. THAF27]QFT97914.1 Lipopolysaccharide-assembly, LptC-related [Roseovarius sp. TH
MATTDNFYSRLVAWMKIILPLAALGLLSTIFLISRHIDPTKSIPIANIDLEQRARDQGATNAAFAGVTSGGDEVTITAETARPATDDPRLINAEDVTAEMRLFSGGMVTVRSDRGDMHQSDLNASLMGNVHIDTTTGYEMTTERLNAKLDVLYAETPGPVSGTGPAGDLTAGRMVLSEDDETGEAHLVFTEGVKLVYTPQPSEDPDQ